MADTEDAPGEKEQNKAPSPKPDQEVAPPLVSSQSKAGTKKDGKEDKGKPTTQRVGKTPKGVVMSSEAMKEKQKQAKANKDERRMQMDGRHKFLILKLADAIGISCDQVEDFIVGDERFDLIEDFFAAKGSRKLLFFYQDAARDNMYSPTVHGTDKQQKKLFLTTGAAEGLRGICYYFLRPENEKAVTDKTIANDIFFGTVDCTGGKLLDGMETIFSKVMMPVLKAQESWGPQLDNTAKIGDFLEQLEKFIGSLNGAKGNMEGHVTLSDTEYGPQLDNMRTAADYQGLANNSETLEKLEELLASWSKQIEQVLTESEQIRREADDIGPSAELCYWKSRMAKFNTLLEQIKSPRCKAVVGVHNAAKSKSIRKWRELDSRITDAANEAKDNVKYLYTLDKFFGPLVKCNPEHMIEHIPRLMNAIRMIYSISSYYNTSERMTSLFVKVTNQMITTCKAYIQHGVTRVWEHPMPLLRKMIDECINLNKEYQLQFQKTKARLKETPNERQFEFSENYIFGKFDTFCKRLEKIVDMINTIEAYSGLGNVRIEGIEPIAVRYKTIVEATKKKNYDILDHRKSEFDADYLEFESQFNGLQAQIRTLVDTLFDRTVKIDPAIHLLVKCENILPTPKTKDQNKNKDQN